MDRLVRFSTGKERAAAATAKWAYALKRQRYRWTANLTMATDVQYYNHLKMLGQASVASLAMFTNRGKLSRLWTSRVRIPPNLLWLHQSLDNVFMGEVGWTAQFLDHLRMSPGIQS